jgi:two-component system chemotaxis response regulator CheB
MTQTVRVVVVDDSPFVCRLVSGYLQSAPDIQVVGTALDGARALELVQALHPSAVTLDLEMPAMDGLEVLDRIMHDYPTPVLLVSGVSGRAAAATLQGLALGAVDFVLKYTPGIDTDPDALRQEIIAKVRLAARIQVIRSLDHLQSGNPNSGRDPGRGERARERPTPDVPHLAPPRSSLHAKPDDKASSYLAGGVVVIGASTGGPLALRELLGRLPADFPAAVLVVQHMPATFTRVLAAQLNRQGPLRVKEGEDGDRLQPGLVLIAPGDYHMLVRGDGRLELVQGPKIAGHRPSVDVTMQSVAQVYGPRAKGVVLTGMGSDGASGLVAIRNRGGQTFVQEVGTCVVGSMPQHAIDKGAVDHVAAPAEIAQLLRKHQVWTWEKQQW